MSINNIKQCITINYIRSSVFSMENSFHTNKSAPYKINKIFTPSKYVCCVPILFPVIQAYLIRKIVKLN